MRVENVVKVQTEVLRGLAPPIEAAGIGGSWGRGSSDRYSDADFFLLYPSEGFFSHLAEFPEKIDHPLPNIVFNGPVFVPGFGFEFSYILEGGISVDYNLNCRESLNLNPMRAHTIILFDTTGFLTEFTQNAATPDGADNHADAEEAFHEYLVRLLKIRKSAFRQDRAVLFYNMDKLRLVMAAVDRVLSLGVAYNSFQADHRLGVQMGEEYEKAILGTFPSPEPGATRMSLHAICERIESGLKNLQATGDTWNRHWRLVREVRSEIKGFLMRLT